MAIRGTLTHRKTRRLSRLLDIPPCYALGVLEALWHVTAEQSPTGDIGRMSDQDIADEMFYVGDATALILALIESGWIDNHPTFRLVVHDWDQHADQSIKRKVARHGLTFASRVQSCLVTPSLPVPVPVPETVPETPIEVINLDKVRGDGSSSDRVPNQSPPKTQEGFSSRRREIGGMKRFGTIETEDLDGTPDATRSARSLELAERVGTGLDDERSAQIARLKGVAS